MTSDAEIDYASLRGMRVNVYETSGAVSNGVLRFIRPADGALIVSDYAGHEYPFPPGSFTKVEDAQYTCSQCQSRVNNIFFDPPLCADCERERAFNLQKTEKPREHCSDCGVLGAVYSPKAGKFRCVQCHAKAGTLSGNTAEGRVLEDMTSCKGSDETSTKHSWLAVKGGRWRCTVCHVDRYTRA